MTTPEFSNMRGVEPEESGSVTAAPSELATHSAGASVVSLSVYDWNFNIGEAPRGKTVPVEQWRKTTDGMKLAVTDTFVADWLWLATKCGKVLKSHWMPPEGKTRAVGRWLSLDVNEQPVAWQAFVVPAHPGFEAPVSEVTK